jgi:hypothetical protein
MPESAPIMRGATGLSATVGAPAPAGSLLLAAGSLLFLRNMLAIAMACAAAAASTVRVRTTGVYRARSRALRLSLPGGSERFVAVPMLNRDAGRRAECVSALVEGGADVSVEEVCAVSLPATPFRAYRCVPKRAGVRTEVVGGWELVGSSDSV